MENQRLTYLIKKYQEGSCTKEEKREIFILLQDSSIEKDILLLWQEIYEEKPFDYSDKESISLYDRILSHEKVQNSLRQKPTSYFIKLKTRKAISIAAALLIFAGISFLVFRLNSLDSRANVVELKENLVLPGNTRAKIVFEDGSVHELDGHEVYDGSHASNFKVGQQEEGISYQITENKVLGKAEMHTLITPIGGEYSVKLADGTRVWLNANSKLKYPISFHGLASREVELEGEAYFDVATMVIDNKHKPFLVKSKGQVLEVLGTEFNINTFRNKVTTTLVEGSVRMVFDEDHSNHFHKLNPNEQSIYDEHTRKINIIPIDPYYAVAWKNGNFAFDHAPLESVMDEIGRWYDVEVDYKAKVSDVQITGKVSKFENIETLLQMIEWTGSVKVKLDGRRIIVMK